MFQNPSQPHPTLYQDLAVWVSWLEYPALLSQDLQLLGRPDRMVLVVVLSSSSYCLTVFWTSCAQFALTDVCLVLGSWPRPAFSPAEPVRRRLPPDALPWTSSRDSLLDSLGCKWWIHDHDFQVG